MHQIGVVGLSYRHVGVDEVARFSVPKTEVPARLPALRDALGVSEVFYVGTCNRVEVLFAMPDGASAGDARRDVFRALIGREPVGGEAEDAPPVAAPPKPAAPGEVVSLDSFRKK